MKDSKMHQTPGLPGTSPVTDNPNPGGSQGMDTIGPSTDTGEGVAEAAARDTGNPTPTRPGPKGGGTVRETSGGGARTFRCADVGNADCRWEVTGRTEDELMPQIEQHGRDKHGIRNWDGETKNKMRNAIRERRAA